MLIRLHRGDLRLCLLLALTIGIAGLEPAALGALLAILGLTALRIGAQSLLLGRVLRLRWFFLAIFLLYLFGPAPVSSAWPEAIYRVGVLVAIVSVVTLSLHELPPQELGAALARWLSPLGWLGFPVQTFARRLAGTLDAVGQMDARLRALRGRSPGAAPGFGALAQLCLDAETHSLPTGTGLQPGPPVPRGELAVGTTAILMVIALQWL